MPIQPVASTRPQLFQSLAERLSAFSNKQEDVLDRQMEKKAKEQGLIDAQGKKVLTLKTGQTIADEAWNEGAVVSHIAAVKLDLNDNLTRIAGESTRDPVAYKEKAKAYSSGLIENLDPSLQPTVQDEVAQVIMRTTAKLEQDERTFIREQQTAQTLSAIDAYETEALNQGLDGDVESALLAQHKANQIIDSAEISGLITPKVAEVRRKKINRNIEVEMIKGEFTRQMNAGGARKFLDLFAKQKAISDFTPDDRRTLQKELIGMMQKSQNIEADGLKADRDARKERWRRGLRKVSLLRDSGELTAGVMTDMVKNDQLDPDDATKFRKAALRGGPEVSDGMVLNLFREDLLNVSDTDIMTSPDLTDADQQKLLEEKQKLEEDLGNWANSPDGREAKRRINSEFKIVKGVASRPTEEQIKQAGRIQTTLFNEVESLPLEERKVRVLEIADRLVVDIKKNETINLINDRIEKINLLEFQTVEEIDASDLDSVQKTAEKKILKSQLQKLKRLEDKRAEFN